VSSTDQRPERPIIFSASMVRAILAGKKRQSRRVVTPMNGEQRRWLTRRGIASSPVATVCRARRDDPSSPLGVALKHPMGGPLGWIQCPYGGPGERLWVREGFMPRYFDDGRPAYRADWEDRAGDVCPEPSWRPSIHMPRALSRITLEITNVRVERLQDISEEDAMAEGIHEFKLPNGSIFGTNPCRAVEIEGTAVEAFATLWDQINGKRATWSANPWLWVLVFRRIQ